MFLEKNYYIVIKLICNTLSIKDDELKEILKKEECKYLFFLLLNKYNCFDESRLKEDFQLSDVMVNKRNAEEKFLINGEFRNTYFNIIKSFNNKDII